MRRTRLGTLLLATACLLFGPPLQPAGAGATAGTTLVWQRVSTVAYGSTPYWSPNGNLFAYEINLNQGIVELGSLHPMRMRTLHLGSGLEVVGLTNRYLVSATENFVRDYLYPIGISLRLGRRQDWVASADPWEQWVPLAAGLALVTGGYQPGSLSLTLQGGGQIPLHGGEMYLSPDLRYGAVLARPRATRVVNPVGDVGVPTELQPDTGRAGIAVWDLATKRAPRRLTLMHLPKAHTSSRYIQEIAFSPDDRYMAVLTWDSGSSSGATYIYSIRGQLLGKGPYGSHLAWLPQGDDLWLESPQASGNGQDLVIGLRGNRVAAWPNRIARVLLPVAPGVAIAQRSDVIGLITGGRFRPVQSHLPRGFAGTGTWSPGGRAALIPISPKHGAIAMWLAIHD